VASFAAAVSIPVVQTWNMPLPPEERQGRFLLLDREED
jgi:hypothetical protein